jgi:hypothetical protein
LKLLLLLLLPLLLLTLLPRPPLLLLLTLLPRPLHLLHLHLLHLLLPNKLHGSAKKPTLGPAFFLYLGYMPDLLLKNLAPAKPIQLIGHPDPFRITI